MEQVERTPTPTPPHKAIRKVVPALQLQRAKTLRVAATPQEKKLWRALRDRVPLDGTHFRRQVPIGPYIVDFCCLASRLIVELDGNQHGTDEALSYDARRTALIESHRFRVLRLTNHEVNIALESVLDTIAAALPPTPTPSPSPQKGGEEPIRHG